MGPLCRAVRKRFVWFTRTKKQQPRKQKILWVVRWQIMRGSLLVNPFMRTAPCFLPFLIFLKFHFFLPEFFRLSFWQWISKDQHEKFMQNFSRLSFKIQFHGGKRMKSGRQKKLRKIKKRRKQETSLIKGFTRRPTHAHLMTLLL